MLVAFSFLGRAGARLPEASRLDSKNQLTNPVTLIFLQAIAALSWSQEHCVHADRPLE
jgi:hypothetical protein